MAFVKVAPNTLLPGGKTAVEVKGKHLMIANIDGKYYAISNKCTHRGCSLSEGTVRGNNIECPCHGSVFDIRTGKAVNGPAKKAEPVLKVKADKDHIFVDV